MLARTSKYLRPVNVLIGKERKRLSKTRQVNSGKAGWLACEYMHTGTSYWVPIGHQWAARAALPLDEPPWVIHIRRISAIDALLGHRPPSVISGNSPPIITHAFSLIHRYLIHQYSSLERVTRLSSMTAVCL